MVKDLPSSSGRRGRAGGLWNASFRHLVFRRSSSTPSSVTRSLVVQPTRCNLRIARMPVVFGNTYPIIGWELGDLFLATGDTRRSWVSPSWQRIYRARARLRAGGLWNAPFRHSVFPRSSSTPSSVTRCLLSLPARPLPSLVSCVIQRC